MCSTADFTFAFPTLFPALTLSTSPLGQGLFKFELCLAKQHPEDLIRPISMPQTKARNKTSWLICFL